MSDRPSLRAMIRGGKRWIVAEATGDIADNREIERRHAICEGCPSLGGKRIPKRKGARFQTCGEFAQETPSTCGCVVGLSVRGRVYPAGKVRVASEKCPQGRW